MAGDFITCVMFLMHYMIDVSVTLHYLVDSQRDGYEILRRDIITKSAQFLNYLKIIS